MRPSIFRRATTEVMRIAAQVPMVPLQRRMSLAALAAARARAPQPPRWSAIFTKAYAMVAAEIPVLRSLLGGRRPLAGTPRLDTERALFIPTDAGLGVAGLPQ